MIRITLFLAAWLLVACTPSECWIAEDESGTTTRLTRGDTLDITAPMGLTLWYAQPLKGNYRISYRATVVMQGGQHDRLADLNCFWMASDPLHPTDFFARKGWRGGIFSNYNSLELLYVGFGGNDNTTTRFRRYYGKRYQIAGAEIKPLVGEYIDPAHLLTPNHGYQIVIEVLDGTTTFSVDGELFFSRQLAPDEGEGYFGLRLLSNHTLISGFKIEYL